jgi:hypothetical protein
MSGIKRLFERGPFTELLWSQALQTINSLINGRANNIGSFTLTANATSTAVTDIGFESQQIIVWMPTTANAAAEIAAGGMYVSARANGTFTVTHANNAQTDRTFSYIRQG